MADQQPDNNLSDLLASSQCLLIDEAISRAAGWRVPVAVASNLTSDPNLVQRVLRDGAEAARQAGQTPYARVKFDGTDYWLTSREGTDRQAYVLVYSTN